MDMGKPVNVDQINILSRNHLNIVEPNNEYELFCFDQGWFSLGRLKSTDYHIEFENVPKGAILWLRNHTQGREERIFRYENDQQVWY